MISTGFLNNYGVKPPFLDAAIAARRREGVILDADGAKLAHSISIE